MPEPVISPILDAEIFYSNALKLLEIFFKENRFFCVALT